MPGQTRLEITEKGKLALIGVTATATATSGRDDFIVESKGSDVLYAKELESGKAK